MPYKNYKKIQYVTGLGRAGKAYLAGVWDYSPVVLQGYDDSDISELGVHEVGDCIGIIAFDPKSKTIYSHHMNSVFAVMITSGLINFAILSGFVPSEQLATLRSLRDNNNEQNVNDAILQINALKLLHNTSFNLITSNLGDGEKMEELLSLLKRCGVQECNIYIDTQQGKMLIDRATGKLCIDFDPKKASLPEDYFDTPEQRMKNREFQKEQAEKKLAIEHFNLNFSPAQKFEYFKAMGFFELNGTILTVVIHPKHNALLDYPEKTWQEIIAYTETLGVNEVRFSFSSPNLYKDELAYQRLPGNMIKHFETHGAHILFLKFIFPHTDINAFRSVFAEDVALALKSSGKHLKEIDVKANTHAAANFVNAIEHLANTGSLIRFNLEPINQDRGWKTPATQVKIVEIQCNLAKKTGVQSSRFSQFENFVKNNNESVEKLEPKNSTTMTKAPNHPNNP